jgi:hypothetical protein
MALILPVAFWLFAYGLACFTRPSEDACIDER